MLVTAKRPETRAKRIADIVRIVNRAVAPQFVRSP
jgi:hypothetical protein